MTCPSVLELNLAFHLRIFPLNFIFSTFGRKKTIKSNFILFFAHLFVPLQPKI